VLTDGAETPQQRARVGREIGCSWLDLVFHLPACQGNCTS
jgi:hypothetical protein